MNADPDRLTLLIDRVQAGGLILPVRAVEVAGGGIIRVTVSGPADDALRARLKAAMGSTWWKLVEADH